VREVGRGEEAEEGRRGEVDEGEDVQGVGAERVEERLRGEEVREVGGRVEDGEVLRDVLRVSERIVREEGRGRAAPGSSKALQDEQVEASAHVRLAGEEGRRTVYRDRLRGSTGEQESARGAREREEEEVGTHRSSEQVESLAWLAELELGIRPAAGGSRSWSGPMAHRAGTR